MKFLDVSITFPAISFQLSPSQGPLAHKITVPVSTAYKAAGSHIGETGMLWQSVLTCVTYQVPKKTKQVTSLVPGISTVTLFPFLSRSEEGTRMDQRAVALLL